MPSTVWIGALLLGTAVVVSAVVPGERLLGRSVGLVYLHGAWVWTALAAYASAAVAGLAGVLRRSSIWPRWSLALGQAGTIFWITYLPLSLVAMRATWGGLYLAEPRWRLGVNFALTALMVQAAILLIGRPILAGAINTVFFLVLALSLASAPAVLHPASPVFGSGSPAIMAAFLVILGLCLGAGYCLARILRPPSA